MDTGISVKITYWTVQNSPTTIEDFEGIERFREELAQHYVSAVHSRPGELGFLYSLVIELVANVSLADVVSWLSGGVAFDLLKSGTKAFVLRPFLAAYKKLRDANTRNSVEISELRIVFQDSIITIYNICDDDSVFPNLERILIALARHYPAMTVGFGERPFEIHIPVFEDKAKDRLVRFRVLLDVDETIRDMTPSDYFRLWGLQYDYSKQSRIFDVPRELLINEQFFTLGQYLAVWKQKHQ